MFGFKFTGKKTIENFVAAVSTLFHALDNCLLLTEKTFQDFIANMTVKPTSKKCITLVEKRCQLTYFIQDIVPFCIAIVDGQHRLGLTTAVLDNIYMDNLVPVKC